MSTLDELEGNGISFQDPWEYGIKNLISREEYDRSLSVSFCQETGSDEQHAWSMVIDTISQNPFMTNDPKEREEYLKESYGQFLEAIKEGAL